jgi:hypothetical protein
MAGKMRWLGVMVVAERERGSRGSRKREDQV